tara:strand:- start:650 stop:760 length:111 start_codon:yes stop_codon:yes gene_type:complete
MKYKPKQKNIEKLKTYLDKSKNEKPATTKRRRIRVK